MLVQGTIAQRVEFRSGPPAAQQPQRIEAVGDQGDRVGLEADQFFLQPGFAAGGLDRLAKLGNRHDVATDETLRHNARAGTGTDYWVKPRGPERARSQLYGLLSSCMEMNPEKCRNAEKAPKH